MENLKNEKTYRNFVFTLNNPTVDEFNALCTVQGTNHVRYILFQLEEGKVEGTPHYQGYIEFEQSVRKSHAIKLFPRASFRGRRGTQGEAMAYCVKNDTRVSGPWSFGTCGKELQGARTDLIKLRDFVTPFMNVLSLSDEVLPTYAKFGRYAEKVQKAKEKEFTKEFRKLNVEIIWGDAGMGKTKKILYDEEGKRRNNVFILDCGECDRLWFDGYEGEDTLLLDDFYGGVCKYSYLLKLLDGHQLRLPTKGSHTYANWSKVYITSNESPANWYKVGMTPALKRRINNIECMTDVLFESVSEVRGNTIPSLPIADPFQGTIPFFENCPGYIPPIYITC